MEEPSWHDREPVALAAGVAAFVLLGVLALAVIRTSAGTTDPAPYVSPVGSSGTTTSSTIKILTTTSNYTVPSAQTSEDSGAPVTTSSAPPAGGTDVPEDAPPPPTTIFNPYATTTQPNAGHV